MKIVRTFLCCILCAAMLLCTVCVYADNDNETSAEEDEGCGVIDGEELTRRIEEYMQSKNISTPGYCVGYCYTATGDKWFYNADEWYYSASLFKVPLMMLFAEKVHEGELTQDSVLYGQDLTTAEEKILIRSITSDAIVLMRYFGTETDCRTIYKKYSDLPDDYFISEYYSSNHFTARFMTDVMTTLCTNAEKFPNIIDCLKQAQPDEYFNLTVGKDYEVAQKYGRYEFLRHTAGIIYTPNPIVVVVMTSEKLNYQELISDTAKILVDYTLELDAKLEAEAEAERLREEEETRRAAEAAATPAVSEAPEQDTQGQKEETQSGAKGVGLTFTVGGIILVLVPSAAVLLRKNRKRKPR